MNDQIGRLAASLIPLSKLGFFSYWFWARGAGFQERQPNTKYSSKLNKALSSIY